LVVSSRSGDSPPEWSTIDDAEGCGYVFCDASRNLIFLLTSGPAHGAIAINLGRVDLYSLLDMTEHILSFDEYRKEDR